MNCSHQDGPPRCECGARLDECIEYGCGRIKEMRDEQAAVLQKAIDRAERLHEEVKSARVSAVFKDCDKGLI